MRLGKIKAYLEEKGWDYRYSEEEGCGSLDFMYRGVAYHVWEFHDQGWGAETNVRNGGCREDITGDYEEAIIEIMRNWQ